jgi:hypothetical protein
MQDTQDKFSANYLNFDKNIPFLGIIGCESRKDFCNINL